MAGEFAIADLYCVYRADCNCAFAQRVDTALANDARFAGNALRSANRATLETVLDKVLGALSSADFTERLDAAPMPSLWAHPQLAARYRSQDIESSAGPIPALLPPSQTDARIDPVPGPAKYTDAILAELGSDPAQPSVGA